MDLNSSNMYIGQKKIKTIYYGNKLVYQDKKTPVTIITINGSQEFRYNYGISFLEMGTITNTSRALPIQRANITGSVSFMEIGTETITTT